MPSLLRKTVSVKPAASTAIRLQQVIEICFAIRRVPELDDLFQDMRELLLKHLWILVRKAFHRLHDGFPADHHRTPSSFGSFCGSAATARTANGFKRKTK